MTVLPRPPSFLPLSPDTVRRFEGKARSIEQWMCQRFGSERAEGQVDLLFVHYLYGAVKAMLPDGEPRLQLGLLRHLAGRSLLPDAVNQALHFRSDSADSAFVRALQTAETIGARDAANICSGPKSGSLELIEPNVNPKSRAR